MWPPWTDAAGFSPPPRPNHQVNGSQAVVHLRRPAGIDLHFLVAAQKLRGDIAFTPEEAPIPCASDKYTLGVRPCQADKHCRNGTSTPRRSRLRSSAGRGVPVHPEPGKLVYRQEAVALHEKQPQNSPSVRMMPCVPPSWPLLRCNRCSSRELS